MMIKYRVKERRIPLIGQRGFRLRYYIQKRHWLFGWLWTKYYCINRFNAERHVNALNAPPLKQALQ